MNNQKRAKILGIIIFTTLTIFAPAIAFADGHGGSALDSADTAWMLTETVLVSFMTLLGLALINVGLVRTKNVLSVVMQCFTISCLASLLWVIGLYSLAFDMRVFWRKH